MKEKDKLIEGYFRYVSEMIAKDEEYNNWDYWLEVIEEEKEKLREGLETLIELAVEDFDGVYKKFPAKEAAAIIKNRMLSAIDKLIT